jgi:hypothetical protein
VAIFFFSLEFSQLFKPCCVSRRHAMAVDNDNERIENYRFCLISLLELCYQVIVSAARTKMMAVVK